MNAKRKRISPARLLKTRFVFLVFAFTGGGTEYLVGVFGKRAKAEIARKDETALGRTAFIQKCKIR